MKTLKSIFNRFLNLITDTFEGSGAEKFSSLVSYDKRQKENVVVNPQNSWKLYDREEFIGYIHSREELNKFMELFTVDEIKERFSAARKLLFSRGFLGPPDFRLVNFDNSIVVKINNDGKFDHTPPSLFGGVVAAS